MRLFCIGVGFRLYHRRCARGRSLSVRSASGQTPTRFSSGSQPGLITAPGRLGPPLRRAPWTFKRRLSRNSVWPARASGRNALIVRGTLAESVIGVYKTELIERRGPWRNTEAVEFATLD